MAFMTDIPEDVVELCGDLTTMRNQKNSNKRPRRILILLIKLFSVLPGYLLYVSF